MRRAFFNSATVVASVALAAPFSAKAWYDHTAVMDWVQPRLEREFPKPGAQTWRGPMPPENGDPVYRYYDVASLLLLQSRAAPQLRSLKAETLHDLLRLAPEDPDHGIDADLPDSADPSDDRRYMGGAKGASSSGFRHMYWSGWNWRRPISTFQIPPRVLGQSVDRIELLANEARERLRKGDVRWAGRILGWTIHYLQDLTQPFHAVQFPTPKMVPWTSLFVWPPTDAFNSLVRESTRVVTNYHWAYEGYVRHALLAGAASPFKECFDRSGGSILVNSPRDLALEVVNRSIGRASETGEALVAFVGTHLLEPSISVPLNPAQVGVEDMLGNPARKAERDRLNAVTCESLRLTTDASIWITRWVFGK